MDTNDDGTYFSCISKVKSLRKSLTDSKRIFVDKDFPAELEVDAVKDRSVQWKRLAELEKQAGLCVDGDPLKGELCEGLLGNDSVAAAITAIAHHPNLLNYIYPPRQNYDSPGFTGLYYLRFWKMGKWVYVVVDDRLPVIGPKCSVRTEKSSTGSFHSRSPSTPKEKVTGDAATESPQPTPNVAVQDELATAQSTDSKKTLKSKKSKTALKSKGKSKLENKPRATSSNQISVKASSRRAGEGDSIAGEGATGLKVQPERNREIFLQLFGPDGSRYFWPAVLEKAYAKFCGGYGKLATKSVQDVLLDMTGGVTEVFRTSLLPPHFFLRLKYYCDTKCVVVATTKQCVTQKSADSSVCSVSSMPITKANLADFRKLWGKNKMISFVRIRNPYETLTWNSDWTEASNQWQLLPRLVREKLSMSVRENGEFYLTYENFLRAFESIVVSTVSDGIRYHCDGYFGNWKHPRGRYDMNNLERLRFHEFPQYKIWVRDPNSEGCPVEFVISLMQNGIPSDADTPSYRTFRIFIFALDANRTYKYPIGFEFFRYNSPVASSEISCQHEAASRFELPAGHYLAVLVTACTNHMFPTDDFLLRMITCGDFHQVPTQHVIRAVDNGEDLNVNITGAETLEEPAVPSKEEVGRSDADLRKDKNRGKKRKPKSAPKQ